MADTVIESLDLTLYPQKDGSAVADTGAIRATLAADLSAAQLLCVEMSGYALHYGTLSLLYVDTSGRHQVLAAVAPAPLVINGSIARYAPTLAPYVVQYEIQGAKTKRDIHVLKPLPAPDPAVFPDMESVYLAVQGPLTVPAGLTVEAEGQPFTDNLWTADTIRMVDANGKLVMFLDRVWAKAAGDQVCAGRYRLVTDPLTGALQIYELLPYWWLRTLTTADYPVIIDPNVTVESPNASRQLHGSFDCGFEDANGTWVISLSPTVWFYSITHGANWTAVTAPATALANANRGMYWDATNNAVYVVGSDGVNAAVVEKYTWSPAAKTLTRQRSTVMFNQPTLTVDQYPQIVKDLDGRLIVSGAWRSSGTALSSAYGLYISIDDGATFAAGTGPSGTAWNNGGALLAVDPVTGATAYVMWNGANTWVTRLPRNATAVDNSSSVGTAATPIAAGIRTSDNKLVFLYPDTATTTPAVRGVVWDSTPATPTVAVWDFLAVNAAAPNPAPIAVVKALGKYWAVWMEGTNIQYKDMNAAAATAAQTLATVSGVQRFGGFDTASWISILHQTNATNLPVVNQTLQMNTAPTQPTLTVPSAFHTPTGLTFTVTHNDPDGGNMTGVYVKVGAQWWDGTNLVAAEPGAPIAVSPSAASVNITIPGAKFVSGQTYQIAAATVDPSGAKGPYNSTAAVTKASTNPSYAQTAPAAASTVNTTKTRVQGTMTVAGGAAPKQYIVRQYATNGTTVLAGPVTVDSKGALDYEIQYVQTTGTGYQTGVIPVDSDGLQGPEVKTAFTVSLTPPPQPTVTATPVLTGSVPRNRVNVANPAPGAGQAAATSNTIIRRAPGATTWRTLATGIAANGSYDDTTAAAGVAYDYGAIATADNATTTTGYTAAPAKLLFAHPWLVHPTDATQSLPLRLTANELIINTPQSITDAETLGATRKSRSTGGVLGAEGELTIICDHRNPRTYDLAGKLKAAKKLSTTWLLKLPQHPGPLMAAIPGEVFEVSLGASRIATSATQTVMTLPFLEVGDPAD